MVKYFHFFKNFPQIVVIHKVKAFGRVNEAEVEVFLELSCFFCDPTDVGNLITMKKQNLIYEEKNMYLILLMTLGH